VSAESEETGHYVEAIGRSALSIYDVVAEADTALWIPGPDLESLLNARLVGVSLVGLPLRTRSKAVKQLVCKALGYSIPSSFRKTRPRFPGQCFDIFVQKSNNLQIWNDKVVPSRRYVIIRVDETDTIARVKVVTGRWLAQLDTTGTLTQKYQARLIPRDTCELVTAEDTVLLRSFVGTGVALEPSANPSDSPVAGQLLSISAIFDRLSKLVGMSFADSGSDQDRDRGGQLQRLVCRNLGYREFHDNGQFPDVLNQLLEVKLQTSPTVDLGLVCPDSTETLEVPLFDGQRIRHCDVRYALFYATIVDKRIILTHFILTTGESFFSRCPQFRGKVLNRKLQLPLPSDFFDD
jgi:hypothetical protein